jgi:NADH-quinone oxidoreductase subunit L
MESYLYIALFAPLVGSLFSALFGNSQRNVLIGIIASALLATSMFASIGLAAYVFSTGNIVHVNMLDWISIGHVSIPFGFVADHVSVTMMVVVTIVSTMVHIHSIGYMDHDKSFNRFFAWLSAFVFSMMILVMSDNFAGLFIGWEGVGLCSWGLIGFWYHKKDQEKYADIENSAFSTLSPHSAVSPSWAANEAFIQNRVADLAMLLGLFLIFWNLGTLQYDSVFAQIGTLDTSTILWIAGLLFVGAMGKSAQFPFNTWLANAMEGPTPVSALIHAATMVTAGVFLVVRANDIFVAVPEVGYVIAALGAFVAIGAASMALVATNMKKIIAFSTLSQLGYMFVAAGLGAYWIALFHLATHAFFKSVLFLGAGNVMHAMNDQINIKKMGGLLKHMPYTGWIMIIASASLAGFPLMAGFFSKDMILDTAFANNAYILWAVLWITAGMTAFYSFRLIMYVFFGKENWSHDEYHPHESQWYVIAAMTPLAILAVIAGFFGGAFKEFILQLLPQANVTTGTTHYTLMGLAVIMSLSAMAFAYFKFMKDETYLSSKFKDRPCFKVLANQYFMNHFWDKAVCQPYKKMSEFSWKEIDLKIVDAIVDGIAKMVYQGGVEGRTVQTGNLSKALKLMAVGIFVLLTLLIAFGLSK